MSPQSPDTLRKWLESLPNRVEEPWLAARTSRGSLTGGQLAKLSLQIATRLSNQGVSRGSRVATILPPDLDLAVNLALMFIGAVSYSIPQGLTVKRGDYGLETLISDVPKATWDKNGQIVMDPLYLLEASGITNFPAPLAFGDDDPCRLVVTSGSTGTPKAMLLSFGQIERRLFGGGSETKARGREFSFVSSAGWYGFKVALENLITQTASYMFSVDSKRFVEDLIDCEIETLVGSPGQLAKLLQVMGSTAPRFWTLKNVNCVGGKLTLDLYKELTAAFGCQVFVRYGSTETGNISSGLFQPDAPAGSVGKVRAGTQVEIMTEDRKPVPNGSAGLIRVKNDELITNYLNPDGTEIPALEDGWFYTGDIGVLDKSGELVVQGRTGSTLNVGGVKVELSTIEDRLKTLTGVQDAVAFILPENQLGVDRLAAALEVTEEFNRDVAIKQVAKLNLGVNLAQIHAVRQFPRSAVGKVVKSSLLASLGLSAQNGE